MYTGEHVTTAGKSIFKADMNSSCPSFSYVIALKLFLYQNLRKWLTVRTEDICCSK
jgi:hypothetical protein